MKRILPVAVLVVGLVLFFALDLDRYVGLESLAANRLALKEWVGAHVLLAPAAYIVTYIVVVAFSLPVAAVMTLAGGFMFGAVGGTLYAVSGATIGATLLFLIARTSFGDYLLARASDGVQRMQRGFAANALSYLLVLRLIPIFPFFLVNLAPAFLGVPLRTYVFATFFGIMPGGFVYALAGAGIGSVLEQGKELTLHGILTPQVVGALVGLALLSLLPVVYKHFRKRDTAAEASDV